MDVTSAQPLAFLAKQERQTVFLVCTSEAASLRLAADAGLKMGVPRALCFNR